jgi:serine phosphatase RsbU (regulator of sigma subunit)
MINSPSKFNYSVMDYNGRKVATGIVVNGTSSISTNNISNGSYIIIFTDGQQQFVEKFVKQ